MNDNLLPNFIMVPQIQDRWCWAATTAAVANFVFSKPPEQAIQQCAIANKQLHRQDCCNNRSGLPLGCNVESGLTTPLDDWCCHTVTYANKLDLDEIIDEIDKCAPVCARVVWEQGEGNGHFVAIVGYIQDEVSGEIEDVIIADSYYGASIETYENFRRSYRTILQTPEGYVLNEGAWTHSYLTKSQINDEANDAGQAA